MGVPSSSWLSTIFVASPATANAVAATPSDFHQRDTVDARVTGGAGGVSATGASRCCAACVLSHASVDALTGAPSTLLAGLPCSTWSNTTSRRVACAACSRAASRSTVSDSVGGAVNVAGGADARATSRSASAAMRACTACAAVATALARLGGASKRGMSRSKADSRSSPAIKRSAASRRESSGCGVVMIGAPRRPCRHRPAPCAAAQTHSAVGSLRSRTSRPASRRFPRRSSR